MSRIASGNTVKLKPKVNIYTALVAAGVVAAIMGLVVVYLRAQTLFPPAGLMPN